MVSDATKSKIRSMLDMKLTVGQVLSGVFTTVTAVVSIVIYVQNTFETKIDSDKKFVQTQEQIKEMKVGFQEQSKLQTEIYGDVKEISGILKSQLAEKTARGNH